MTESQRAAARIEQAAPDLPTAGPGAACPLTDLEEIEMRADLAQLYADLARSQQTPPIEGREDLRERYVKDTEREIKRIEGMLGG